MCNDVSLLFKGLATKHTTVKLTVMVTEQEVWN